MNNKNRRKSRKGSLQAAFAALSVLLVLVAGLVGASIMESNMFKPVENAGKQLTAIQTGRRTAQYFVDDQWVWEKDLDTLLIIGIDDFGSIAGSDSYNNTSQADFLVLLITDPETSQTQAIHLNRDTMANIPVLGVTGQQAGTRWGQLALAYTYGKGREDSCENTVKAVEDLLYGIEVDHYIAITMDAVPIMNEWMGGVTLEVLDDFTGIDDTLVQGQMTVLHDQHALNYVRTRMGLDDSTNLHRMERQRQYAAAWLDQSKVLFDSPEAVLQLVLELDGYYYSDCTANELTIAMDKLTEEPLETIHQLAGENVLGDVHMEYHADEAALQKLVIDLFYVPTGV